MADDDAEVEALTLGATTTEVVLVRHAERLDEVPDAAVQNDRPWWDPPITTKGIQQSRAAGERLRELHAQRAFEYVMVSPCARTIQTASHIAAALRLPLVLVPGLSECAAAIHKYGLAAFAPDVASSGSAGSSNATRRGRTPVLTMPTGWGQAATSSPDPGASACRPTSRPPDCARARTMTSSGSSRPGCGLAEHPCFRPWPLPTTGTSRTATWTPSWRKTSA